MKKGIITIGRYRTGNHCLYDNGLLLGCRERVRIGKYKCSAIPIRTTSKIYLSKC